MASTPDFLDCKREEIANRMKDLEPLVDEHRRLAAAAAALESVSGSANGATAEQPSRTVAKRSAKPASGRKRGRPKGSGERHAQALAIVRELPGISIPEIAAKMNMKQNYLYRVLPSLAEDGLVVKDGRGWYPKAAG